LAGFLSGFGIEAVRVIVRFDTVSGQGFFRFFAHIVGVLLGVKGTSVVNVLDPPALGLRGVDPPSLKLRRTGPRSLRLRQIALVGVGQTVLVKIEVVQFRNPSDWVW
jgi:hypothetical protein